MTKKTYIVFTFLLFACYYSLLAQQKIENSFQVIPLGVKGGLDESNLSSYMIAPSGSNNFICADAGTIRHGVDVAISHHLFKGNAEDVVKNNIKGYLISHAHLDHVAGLIMNSPDDSPKNIYALPSVIDVLRDKYFTWKAWANFTNEGEMPRLGKYTYVPLKENEKKALAGTEMEVTAFPLSHGPSYESSAFLIGHQDAYILYLGDTGSDQVEKSTRLQQLWEHIAPLITKNQLKAIFIETSFPDKQPEKLLFGHLTPHLLMAELGKLSQLTNPAALKKVSIVITHTKSFGKEEQELIAELEKDNLLQLKLVVPEQGKSMFF